MPRYIDADNLLVVPNVRKVTEFDESGCGIDYRAVPEEAVINAPTVDAVPARHGKWEDCYPNDEIISDTVYACSVCGACVFKNFAPNMNYCPNCGAKMQGGTNEE